MFPVFIVSTLHPAQHQFLHCNDFAKKFKGKLDYWYDGTHTTALGSKAIAESIIDDLIKIIKKEKS